MAYNDETEFPREGFHDNLGSDRVISTSAIRVAGGVVSNENASPNMVVFRDAADTTDLLRIVVPAGDSVLIPRFYAKNGLRVNAPAAGGSDMYVVVATPLKMPE